MSIKTRKIAGSATFAKTGSNLVKPVVKDQQGKEQATFI